MDTPVLIIIAITILTLIIIMTIFIIVTMTISLINDCNLKHDKSGRTVRPNLDSVPKPVPIVIFNSAPARFEDFHDFGAAIPIYKTPEVDWYTQRHWPSVDAVTSVTTIPGSDGQHCANVEPVLSAISPLQPWRQRALI